jgi:hypothetical protein
MQLDLHQEDPGQATRVGPVSIGQAQRTHLVQAFGSTHKTTAGNPYNVDQPWPSKVRYRTAPASIAIVACCSGHKCLDKCGTMSALYSAAP